MQTNKDNTTIFDIVDYMKEYISQSKKRDYAKEFEFLHSLLTPYSIKMSFEILKEKEESELKMVEYEEEKKGVLRKPNFSFMNTPGYKPARVVLSIVKGRTNFVAPLAFEANGVILDSNSWDMLVYPSAGLTFRYNKRRLIKNLHKYKIYPIQDGTIINLYYYDDKWCFSSANGFFVNNHKWLGEKTYEDAFREVAGEYKEFSFDKLDKNCSYTIGFRHHDFHPLLSDPQKLWLVKYWSRTSENPKEEVPSIGIPWQKPIDIASLCYSNKLESMNNSIFNYIQKNNLEAFKNYHTAMTGNTKVPIKKPKEGVSIHYGYILRGPFEELGEEANVVIESELFKFIRQVIYNVPNNKKAEVEITHKNRLDYILLRSYLNRDVRNNFLKLFPQFKQRHNNYENLVSNIANRILSLMKHSPSDEKGKTKITSRGRQGAMVPREKKQNQIIDTIANYFYQKINNKERINLYDRHTISIINDLIVNVKYLNLYFEILDQ